VYQPTQRDRTVVSTFAAVASGVITLVNNGFLKPVRWSTSVAFTGFDVKRQTLLTAWLHRLPRLFYLLTQLALTTPPGLINFTETIAMGELRKFMYGGSSAGKFGTRLCQVKHQWSSDIWTNHSP
jgi:hypothetical protein